MYVCLAMHNADQMRNGMSVRMCILLCCCKWGMFIAGHCSRSLPARSFSSCICRQVKQTQREQEKRSTQTHQTQTNLEGPAVIAEVKCTVCDPFVAVFLGLPGPTQKLQPTHTHTTYHRRGGRRRGRKKASQLANSNPNNHRGALRFCVCLLCD